MRYKFIAGVFFVIIGLIFIFAIDDETLNPIESSQKKLKNGTLKVDGKTYKFKYRRFANPISVEDIAEHPRFNQESPLETVKACFQRERYSNINDICNLFAEPKQKKESIRNGLKQIGKSWSEYIIWDRNRFKDILILGEVFHSDVTAVIVKSEFTNGDIEYSSFCLRKKMNRWIIDEKIKKNNMFFRALSVDDYSLFSKEKA